MVKIGPVVFALGRATDGRTDRRTDGQTNGRTNIVNYRVASLLMNYRVASLLKNEKFEKVLEIDIGNFVANCLFTSSFGNR